MKKSLLVLLTLLSPVQGRSAPSACRANYDQAEAAAGTLIEGKDYWRYPASKKSSLELSRVLSEYPGNLDEKRQTIFRELLSTKKAESLDLSHVFAPSDCPIVRYFTLSKASLDSVTAYSFSKEEKAQVRKHMVSFLKKDFEKPMILLQLHMGFNLIERMQERGLIEKAKLEKLRFYELKKSLAAVVKEQREAMKPWEKVDSVKAYQSLEPGERAKFNEAVRAETLEVEKLRGQIPPLLSALAAD